MREAVVERLRDVVERLRDELVVALPRPDAVERPRDVVERLRDVVARPRDELLDVRLRDDVLDPRPRAVVDFPREELDELEPRLRDGVLFEPLELDFCLLTVRAATCFARPVDAPRFFALLLTFEY